MKYLLDTDIISNYSKPRRNARVDAWLESVDDRDLYLSILTYAEIWYGIHRLPPGKRRTELETWAGNKLATQFFNQVVFFGAEAARQYGYLLARAEKNGHTAGAVDAMIAAIALTEGMTVATLNRKDFERLGVQVVEF